MTFRTSTFGMVAGLVGLVLGACTNSYGEQRVIDALAPAFIPAGINNRINDLKKQGRFKEAEKLQLNTQPYVDQLKQKALLDAIRESGSRQEVNIYSQPQAQPQFQPQPQVQQQFQQQPQYPQQTIIKVIDKREIMRNFYRKKPTELKYYESIQLAVDFDKNGDVTAQEIEESSRRNVFYVGDEFWIKTVLKNPDDKPALINIPVCPIVYDSSGNIVFKGGMGPGLILKPGEINGGYAKIHWKATQYPGDYCLMIIKANTTESPGSDCGTIKYFTVEER